MKPPPLKPAEMTMVHAVFRRHPEIETATLFGSRAKDTHSERSNVDLVVTGDVSLEKAMARFLPAGLLESMVAVGGPDLRAGSLRARLPRSADARGGWNHRANAGHDQTPWTGGRVSVLEKKTVS